MYYTNIEGLATRPNFMYCFCYAITVLKIKYQIRVCNYFYFPLSPQDWKSMLNDGLHLSNKGSHFLFSLLRPIVGKHTSHLPFKLPYWGDVDPENLNSLLD